MNVKKNTLLNTTMYIFYNRLDHKDMEQNLTKRLIFQDLLAQDETHFF